jgi:DNA-binding MarR family transcriptional regulator
MIFVLAYANYFNERKDYGSGPKLTLVEVHILTQIYDNPGTTVTEIAKIWNRTTSAISQTVRKLMKQDLVYRENSTSDGKVFHLYTTELGKETSMAHKRYDNDDITNATDILLEKFSMEDLIKFSEICSYSHEILSCELEKENED